MFSGADTAVGGHILGATLPPLVPFLLIPAATALLSVVAQQALVFAPTKLKPQLSRISPIKGAKNKFGRNGLFEFAKSFAKLCIFSAILFLYLWARLPELLMSIAATPGQVTVYMLTLCLGFLAMVLAVAAALGVVDLLWQRAEHLHRNRMSHREMRDEHKQMEGDPYIKQQRRQRATEIATNRMLADVPEADVVIVNPTHYAVALRYDQEGMRAPRVVAKGADLIAAEIRERARAANVPLFSAPPLARALYFTTRLDQEIPAGLYVAVAHVLAYVYQLRAATQSGAARRPDPPTDLPVPDDLLRRAPPRED
jgi:flagellar biosynthetic protein FlhB